MIQNEQEVDQEHYMDQDQEIKAGAQDHERDQYHEQEIEIRNQQL
jgi:hypothetical protein